MKHMLTVDYIEFCLLTYNILVIYNYFGYATLNDANPCYNGMSSHSNIQNKIQKYFFRLFMFL